MRIFSILHTSYLIPHTSYLIPHTSYLIPHACPCVRVCVRRQPTVTTGTTRRWQQVTRTCAAEGHGRHGLVPLKDTDVYADVCGCRACACARAANGHRGIALPRTLLGLLPTRSGVGHAVLPSLRLSGCRTPVGPDLVPTGADWQSVTAYYARPWACRFPPRIHRQHVYHDITTLPSFSALR